MVWCEQYIKDRHVSFHPLKPLFLREKRKDIHDFFLFFYLNHLFEIHPSGQECVHIYMFPSS